jgi:hypothetical protein
MYLSGTVKIHELRSILVSIRVMVQFTSRKGGKIVSFWGENTSRNSRKKFGLFSGMAAAENHV